MTEEREQNRLSLVIPTYRRDAVLIDTLHCLHALRPLIKEILVVDQTERHSQEARMALQAMDGAGTIRWIRGLKPCIPCAMNRGLLEATGDLVLFLDDDIRPEPELFAAHLAAHAAHPEVIVAGRVIQPWQEGLDFASDPGFHFASVRDVWCDEFMGGNFSLSRRLAIALGGFDENFVQVAYRFEAEFATRWRRAGRRVRFTPAACIHHLKTASGGTRTYGEHLRTARPAHSVGAYYFFFATLPAAQAWAAAFGRLFGAVRTRHHLRRPWWIPLTLWAEGRGLAWARRLYRCGPQYLQ